jgi:hypothetical protein
VLTTKLNEEKESVFKDIDNEIKTFSSLPLPLPQLLKLMDEINKGTNEQCKNWPIEQVWIMFSRMLGHDKLAKDAQKSLAEKLLLKQTLHSIDYQAFQSQSKITRENIAKSISNTNRQSGAQKYYKKQKEFIIPLYAKREVEWSNKSFNYAASILFPQLEAWWATENEDKNRLASHKTIAGWFSNYKKTPNN